MGKRRCALVVGIIVLGGTACHSAEPLPPAVFVEPNKLTLEDGQSAKLTATLRNPPGARTVRWASSNTAVATVDLSGNVTAVANGTTNVVVRLTEDTTISATVPVTVSGPAIATMTLSPASSIVYVGLARQIAVQLRAADGRAIRGRAVTWTTPDATIADVTSTGVVRGRGPGGPIVLVASSEGRSATAQVRVAHAAENCPFINALAIGQRVEGRLALGDCEFSLDNSYVDVYEITLAAAATIQFDMTSSDLDAYIGLFDGRGVFLAEDDNSGGGQNARLVRDLAAGKYRVWANAISATSTGAYAFVVTQR